MLVRHNDDLKYTDYFEGQFWAVELIPLGFKSNNFMDPGHFYTPYIPKMLTPKIS